MEFFESIQTSGFGSVIMTFLVSMLPVIELRGAIPLGVIYGLSPLVSMIVSIIGNLVPVAPIIIFIRRIFEWLRTKSPRLEKFVESMESKAYSKKDLIRKWQVLGLALLVAIPLPGTGAWTGALVAAILDIRLKDAIPAIILGVVVAGIIVTLLTAGVAGIFG